MNIRTAIRYLLVTPDYTLEDVSPFQGHAWVLLDRLPALFHVVRNLPPNATEPFAEQLPLIEARVAGLSPFQIWPATEPSILRLDFSVNDPFWVLISDEETVETVDQLVRSAPFPMLHASSADDDRAVRLTALDSGVVRNHVIDVVRFLDANHPEFDVSTMMQLIERRPERDRVEIGVRRWNHNCTLPNEIALESIGFNLKDFEEPLFGNSDEPYIDAILKVAFPLTNARESDMLRDQFDALSPRTPSLILASPATYKHFQHTRFHQREGGPDRLMVALLRSLQRQTRYSAELDLNRKDFEELFASGEAQRVIEWRSEELRALTVALSARCTSQQVPLIRIPPKVNRALGPKKNLAICARGKGANRQRKINRLAREVMTGLAGSVDDRLMQAIDRPHTGIKLVSDAPLEWLPVRGLPLMLRSSVSRITATPGDLCFQLVIPPEQLALTLADFKEVLVIRSFRSGDPVAPLLEASVAGFSLKRISVRFVDVIAEQDVYDALNEFQGAMVIFDCHGAHHEGEDTGRLVLAGGELDPWKLKGNARPLPIVVLSACDTQAIDGSHSTTSNGFLAWGARTVIASMLPIAAVDASIFAAKLLYRLEAFVPLLTERGQAVRWSDVVSYLQRMVFAHNLVIKAVESGLVAADESRIRRLMVRCTQIVHQPGDWYEEILNELSPGSQTERERIDSLREQWPLLSEAIRYVQMGNPDSVVILPSDP